MGMGCIGGPIQLGSCTRPGIWIDDYGLWKLCSFSLELNMLTFFLLPKRCPLVPHMVRKLDKLAVNFSRD